MFAECEDVADNGKAQSAKRSRARVAKKK